MSDWVLEYLYKDLDKEALEEAAKSLQDDLDRMDEEGWYSGDQGYQDVGIELSYVENLLKERENDDKSI